MGSDVDPKQLEILCRGKEDRVHDTTAERTRRNRAGAATLAICNIHVSDTAKQRKHATRATDPTGETNGARYPGLKTINPPTKVTTDPITIRTDVRMRARDTHTRRWSALSARAHSLR